MTDAEKDYLIAFIEEYCYQKCPECGHIIWVGLSGRFKYHKKDNGIKCPYSYNVVQGLAYRRRVALAKLREQEER